jgi:hypothetical protein
MPLLQDEVNYAQFSNLLSTAKRSALRAARMRRE